MERNEMPVGFAMALAMNPSVMQKFETLSKYQKRVIIEETHTVKSRDEMHRYVYPLVNDKR